MTFSAHSVVCLWCAEYASFMPQKDKLGAYADARIRGRSYPDFLAIWVRETSRR